MTTAANPFKPASKTSSRLRLALIGPPGSGKTYTALALATALGRRVALIDTEFESASKYAPPEGQAADPAAGTFPFDAMSLTDFHPRRYVEAIAAAETAGYDVVVIDSLSHAWVGKGGGLDLHDKAVDRQKVKNSFTAWAEVTPHHNALVEAIVQSKIHVIATIRSKTEYVQEKDERTGRPSVRKVGMAPVMRDGIEYEFDVTGDLDLDNTLVISKTRCPALHGAVIRKPGGPLARTLAAWLGAGPASVPTPIATPEPAPRHQADAPATPADVLPIDDRQLERLDELVAAKELDDTKSLKFLGKYKKKMFADLTLAEAADLIRRLEKYTPGVSAARAG